MAVERRSLTLNNVLSCLEIPSSLRKQSDLENIVRYASSFKFFQEIVERQSNSEMLMDIAKVLSLSHQPADSQVFLTGDSADFFYFIIRGSVKVLSNSYVEMDETGDDEIHRMIRKALDLGQPRAKKLREAGPEVEVMMLYPGQSFGQSAIISEKSRYYSVITVDACSFIRLHKDDYFGLEGTQEKQINEKMDFLRTLQMFKTWSRVALYNITFYFKELKFRRAAKVYSEGDLANAVYIIKEGEFKFTQRFSIDAGNPLTVTGKSSKTTKSAKGNTMRSKNLQIVTRQPGELFGIEEILDKSPVRYFTCTCMSQTGKLLVISEKNFFKKITHPESIKFYEEQHKTFKSWVDPRLDKLRELELFKDDTSFTPFQKLKVVSRIGTSSVGERLRSFNEVNEDNTPLPLIIKKIMVNRNSSAITSERRRMQGSMFATEFFDDSDKFANFNFTSNFSDCKDMVFVPAKLIKGKILRNRKKGE